MTSPLWRRIKRFVESGPETPKVDLKLTQDISGRVHQAEFAKDVTAIAPSRRRRGSGYNWHFKKWASAARRPGATGIGARSESACRT